MRRLYIPSVTCILSCLLCTLIISCEYDTSSVPEPLFEKKLVVHSFIAPTDTELYVSVAYNRKVLGVREWGNGNLSDVKVFMSDGSKEAQFTLRNDSFILKTRDFPILSGETYFLKVIDSEGRMAVSSCKVPSSRKLDVNVASDTASSVEDWGKYTSIRTNTALHNLNSEKSYLKVRYYYEIYSHNNLATNVLSYIYNGEYAFFNKYGEDSARFYNEMVYFSDDPVETIDSAFLKLRILQYPEEYCTYKKSIEDYANDQTYFSEPRFVYSNINGGYGFFGGYTEEEFRMKLNKDMVENK